MMEPSVVVVLVVVVLVVVSVVVYRPLRREPYREAKLK